MAVSDAAPVKITGVSSETLAERGRVLPEPDGREALFSVKDLKVSYGDVPALQDVSLDIYRNFITAFIGPSGCGKSTFIRCFNRMNDLIPTAVVEGTILYHGQDLYGGDVDRDVVERLRAAVEKVQPAHAESHE